MEALELLNMAQGTLGEICENCGWWVRCLTQLSDSEREIQYSSCFENDEPFFVFP